MVTVVLNSEFKIERYDLVLFDQFQTRECFFVVVETPSCIIKNLILGLDATL